MLLPLFPPPPPPQNPDQVRNFLSVSKNQAISQFPFPTGQLLRFVGEFGVIRTGMDLKRLRKKDPLQLLFFWIPMETFNLMRMRHPLSQPKMVNSLKLLPPASTRYAFNRTTRRQMLPSPLRSTKHTWPGSILSRLPTHLFSDFRIVTPMQIQIRKASNQMKPANRIHNHRMNRRIRAR